MMSLSSTTTTTSSTSSSSSPRLSSTSTISLVSLCRYGIILFSTIMGFTFFLSYHQYIFVDSIIKRSKFQPKNNTIIHTMMKHNLDNTSITNSQTIVDMSIHRNNHHEQNYQQHELNTVIEIADTKKQGTIKIVSSKKSDNNNSYNNDKNEKKSYKNRNNDHDINNSNKKKNNTNTKKDTKSSTTKVDKENKEKKKKGDNSTTTTTTTTTKTNNTLTELSYSKQKQQKSDTTKEKESKSKLNEVNNKQYDFESNDELFHVTHPMTGKIVISRYGYNYKNRTQRFPSISQRIMLYMSNWYLPACTSNDISSIHYSSQFFITNTTNSTTNVNSTTSNSSIETERRSATEKITTNFNNNNNNNSIPYIRVSSAIIPETYDNDTNDNTTRSITQQQVQERLEWDFNNIVQPDTVFYIDSKLITIAATNTSNSFVMHYSTDVNDTILPSMKRLDKNNKRRNNSSNKNKTQTQKIPIPPILIEFGDRVTCSYHNDRKGTVNNVPLLRKFRTAIISDIDRYNIAMNNETTSNDTATTTTINTINCTSKQRYHIINTTKTLQPIIWKLNSIRHYSKITDGEIDSVDTIPYYKKNNVAIFRGAMTGIGVSAVWDPRISNFDICYRTPRCRLVMMFADNNSTTGSNPNTNGNNNNTTPGTTIIPSYTIDVKLTKRGGVHDNHPWIIDVPINYTYENNFPLPYNSIAANQQQKHSNITNHTTKPITLLGKIISIQDIVRNKIIIILEGNDVSSGLKWALYSQCVVLMPYPVLTTSWAMEELLEPYIHFVPIYHNLTNIHEQIQWILSNEKEAQYISYRSTIWIKDLLFYPTDDQLIQDEILTRYQSNFFYNESLLLVS